ncbi:unnamed protein product [Microthlaspi erraticum]|uniref:Bromo domain-containing protein n=1 Tax=Microthlaspi erraticum TaxID=1685480 RepID=A0A6D2LKS4_9BRAS|nr:unnamed protein product [Microthlaspi erraticum]
MAKPENGENYPEKQTWSTWEELLLACAVHRYGTDSWDSVAAEIQKQNSTPRTLTAFDCRHKYHDLKGRFSRKLGSPGSGEEETVAEISSVPWLEELRKLRVDELRREVERYDLSISSLQLKVKRLEDEREKSLTETETEALDLDKIAETTESQLESVHNSDGRVPETPASPDPKDNSPGTGSEDTNIDRKITESVDVTPNRIGGEDNDEKPDSCRGSCESEPKESPANSGRPDPVRDGNDSPEFVEPIDESKGEEEAKETSDVQSSASLPRKDTVEQDELDNVDQSLTVNRIPVESQPLIDFIESVQSHPIGFHFSSQETPEYDKIIRQHIDLEMIRNRVEENYYTASRSKFFRDLLLLINNARVFYGERSSEFDAATQLSQLIQKQMMMTLQIPEPISPPKEETLVTSKEEVTVSSLKPTMSVPIIACRKRSSLTVRSSASATEPFSKKTTVDEKPVSEEEEDETSEKDEEPIASNKMARGKTTSAAKKIGSKNVKTSLNVSEPKKSDQEKKGNNSKKQSAASFLKRMKGVSSSETVPETVKADSSIGKRGAEQRRSNSKNDKVVVSQKRSSGKKPAIEKVSPAKKNTSSATKRGVSQSSPMVTKRDSEEAGSSTRPKKRSKR